MHTGLFSFEALRAVRGVWPFHLRPIRETEEVPGLTLKKGRALRGVTSQRPWLRGLDLNQRPSGYEQLNLLLAL
jgi:hypothetical protein